MTPHKYAELLIYAAGNADARFTSVEFSEFNEDSENSQYGIETVTLHSDFNDWQIYKEPVTETVWYWRTEAHNLLRYDDAPVLPQKWFMKITYIDGKPTNPVFSEDSK